MQLLQINVSLYCFSYFLLETMIWRDMFLKIYAEAEPVCK